MTIPSCYYDNPDTMRREFWVNGELRWFITAELLYFVDVFTPKEWKAFCKDPFTLGNIKGDPEALKKSK